MYSIKTFIFSKSGSFSGISIPFSFVQDNIKDHKYICDKAYRINWNNFLKINNNINILSLISFMSNMVS